MSLASSLFPSLPQFFRFNTIDELNEDNLPLSRAVRSVEDLRVLKEEGEEYLAVTSIGNDPLEIRGGLNSAAFFFGEIGFTSTFGSFGELRGTFLKAKEDSNELFLVPFIFVVGVAGAGIGTVGFLGSTGIQAGFEFLARVKTRKDIGTIDSIHSQILQEGVDSVNLKKLSPTQKYLLIEKHLLYMFQVLNDNTHHGRQEAQLKNSLELAKVLYELNHAIMFRTRKNVNDGGVNTEVNLAIIKGVTSAQKRRLRVWFNNQDDDSAKSPIECLVDETYKLLL